MLLYTWIDIQDTLDAYFDDDIQQHWLNDISFRAYWDGLSIQYASPKNEKEICAKLEDIFLARFRAEDNEQYVLLLENDKKLAISFELVEQDEIRTTHIKPSLARKPFIAHNQLESEGQNSLQSPTFFAFHSFKGGVGRTLHSIAFALQLAEKGKVLLIDADFEAPGITWLIENRTISLADFLAMIHGSSKDEVIQYTANVMKKDAENDRLFVLPAFRILNEKASSILEIKPEHILKFSKEPFILSDIIENLGKALEVDYIVMDLRAGMSELSTGWLLDPRIHKVFVTTLSSQSLLGTAMMFNILSKFEHKNHIQSENKPYVIVSQIPKTSLKEIALGWNTDDYTESTIKPLRDAYTQSFINLEDYKQTDTESEWSDLTDEQILAQAIAPYALFVEEYAALKFLPDTWDAVCERIRSVELHKQMALLSNYFPLHSKEVAEDFRESRKKLHDFAEKMIFAEKHDMDDFLVTESIRKLVGKYRTQVPIAVIVGAKGAGKTFLYKQIIRLKNWKNFIEKVIDYTHNNSALIFPVTIPLNSGTIETSSEIMAITKYSGANIWSSYIKPDIEKSLLTNLTVSEWRDKWLDYMAWATGFRVGEIKASKAFIPFLVHEKTKMVGVFDGLEDIFKEFNSNPQQKKALEALLQDVPNWLESQPEKYLGIAIFVRKDIVLATITQNSGQFLDRYNDFELKWNTEEVLRLVNWILLKGNIFKNYSISIEKLSQKTETELVEPLYKLWGKRLGKDTSSEAYSHNWVLGSLANLKKEVQSRDIVRFLSVAAKESNSNVEANNIYKDRILFPANIRNAIQAVGTEKISEVKNENEPLKEVLQILENRIRDLEFPCKIEILKKYLTEGQINILENNGVITIYKAEYYMAEIYRKGMNFNYSRKGKPKVLYI